MPREMFTVKYLLGSEQLLMFLHRIVEKLWKINLIKVRHVEIVLCVHIHLFIFWRPFHYIFITKFNGMFCIFNYSTIKLSNCQMQCFVLFYKYSKSTQSGGKNIYIDDTSLFVWILQPNKWNLHSCPWLVLQAQVGYAPFYMPSLSLFVTPLKLGERIQNCMLTRAYPS